MYAAFESILVDYKYEEYYFSILCDHIKTISECQKIVEKRISKIREFGSTEYKIFIIQFSSDSSFESFSAMILSEEIYEYHDNPDEYKFSSMMERCKYMYDRFGKFKKEIKR